MSLYGLDEDGLDRLADYVAGVLDGDEADAVARLVATDPEWRTAYAELTAADAAVRTLLAEESDRAEPMPASVVARVDAALRAEAGSGAQGDRGAAVVSLDSRRRSSRRGWVAGLVAAAAAVGVVGVGLAVQTGSLNLPISTADGGARDNAVPQAGDAVSGPTKSTGTQVRATGTDYGPQTLAALLRSMYGFGSSRGPAVASDGAVPEATPAPPGLPAGAPSVADLAAKGVGDLDRLLDPAALARCEEAVAAVFPGAVTSIDYARFNGVPALVLVIVGTPPTPTTAVVVGKDCGLNGMDTLASAR